MLLIGISLGVIGEEKGRKEKKQGAEARARGGKNGSGKRRAEGKTAGFIFSATLARTSLWYVRRRADE